MVPFPKGLAAGGGHSKRTRAALHHSSSGRKHCHWRHGGCKAKPVNYKRAGTMRILFISVPLEIRTECLVPTKGPINTHLMKECCGRMSRGSHCGKRRCVLGRRSSTCEGRPGEMKLTR